MIAQRKSSDQLSDKWEFPGGKIEHGETPEECLARELTEEFDLAVIVGDFLGSNVHHYDHISIELMVYRASWVRGAISMNDHKAYRWVTLDKLGDYEFAPADMPFLSMLRRGQIVISTHTDG